jgi:hypothetical protein
MLILFLFLCVAIAQPLRVLYSTPNMALTNSITINPSSISGTVVDVKAYLKCIGPNLHGFAVGDVVPLESLHWYPTLQWHGVRWWIQSNGFLNVELYPSPSLRQPYGPVPGAFSAPAIDPTKFTYFVRVQGF